MRNKRKLLSLLLALTMLFTLLPAPVAYAEGDESMLDDEVPVGEYSADGTRTQPFESGAANSKNFRIPAIVTLNDGTLVAAADARWSGTGDNGGIDTLIAISEDNGATWTNVWGNYLGSNAETGKNDSANGTFIDPSLATDGETIYMLVDLFPRGNSNLATGLPGNAFTDDGHMRLSAGKVDNNESRYTYYLSAFTNDTDEAAQRASIVDSEGKTVENYTVDRWFNLYLNGAKVSNLFYADAAYQAYPINYLYLTKSADKGNTWSAPTLINVKKNGEIFYGTGTGSGIVTSDGTIIFPCYEAEEIKTSALASSVIYLKDEEGATWTRSGSIGTKGKSSEAAIAEITLGNANYLYLFPRNDGSNKQYYYISADDGATWSAAQDAKLSNTPNSAMGAIAYSKLIDGRPAILLASPSGSEGRKNGMIFVGLVQDDGSIDWDYDYSVNKGDYYAYSDLTELNDGTIGLLYESASGSITYKAFDMATLAPGAVLTDYPAVGAEPTPGTTPETPETPVTPPTITVKQGEEEISAELTLPAEGEEATVYTLTASEECTWTVDKPDVVTLAAKAARAAEVVGESVDVTPVGEGTVTITATPTAENGTPATVQLTVKAAAANDAVTEHVSVTLKVDETSSTYTQDGSLTATDADTSIATVSTETINTPGETTYEPAALAEGTFYVSTSSSATAPTAQLTFEAVGDGTYYIKNSSGSYIYPDASYANFVIGGWWSYSLKEGQQPVTVTANGAGGYQVSRSVTSGSRTTTAYLTLSGSSFSASETAATLYLYTANTAEGTTTTDVTFTGTGEGTTTVTVGNTEYTVTVSAKTDEKTQTLSFGASFALPEGYEVESYNGGVISVAGTTITAADIAGSATVIAVRKNAGGKVAERVTYDITVTDIVEGKHSLVSAEDVSYSTQNSISAGDEVTGLLLSHSTVSNGTTSFVLKSGSTEAGVSIQSVSVDGSAATAVLNSNGTVTVTGAAAGTCSLAVTFSDGSVTTIPVRVVQGSENSTYALKQVYYFDAVYHSDLYYAVGTGNAGVDTTWTQVKEGYVFNIALDSGSSSNNGQQSVILLAAKPESGYAISYVVHSISNSNGNWAYADGSYNFIGTSENSDRKFGSNFTFNADGTVNSDNGVTSATATYYFDYCYKKGGVVKSKSDDVYAYDYDEFVTLLNAAADSNLQVGFLYSVSVGVRLQVISDKLPTMEKTIKSVNGKAYTEGMAIGLGDTITYTLKFTSYHTHKSTFSNAANPTIEYSNVKYTDELTGDIEALLSGGLTKSVPTSDGATFVSNPEELPMDEKKTVDVSFKLTMGNFGKVKDGKLENTASVTYEYTAYKSKGASKASAKADAVTCVITTPTYVVDFGVPVSYDLTDILGNATLTKAESSLGVAGVAVDGRTLTYTANKPLTGADYVELELSGNQHYAVTIVPASNVLYEENFFTAATGWTMTGTTPSEQQASQLANAEGDHYGFDTAYDSAVGSLGVYAATGLTPETSTDALTTTFYGNGFDLIGTCAPTSGHILLVISELVNGNVKGGYIKSVDTRYKNGTIYQVPFAHVELGKDATWQVKVVATGLAADEANGYEAGTSVEIDAFRVYRSADTANTTTTGVSAYYAPSEQDITYVNILDAVGSTITAYTENENELTIDVLDYEGAGGPQNEIYLASGQSVQITVSGAASSIQVSLRAVNNATSWNTDNDIISNTEMYYDVAVENGVATITNTGDALLAIGNVKVPSGVTVDGPNAAEPEALVYSLRMALTSAPVYDPFVNVDVISTSIIRNKLVTLSISTSTDVKTLTVNGKLLRPTNSIAVKYGWSNTYTYAFVETVRRGETKDYTIVATNADGSTCTRTVQG